MLCCGCSVPLRFVAPECHELINQIQGQLQAFIWRRSLHNYQVSFPYLPWAVCVGTSVAIHGVRKPHTRLIEDQENCLPTCGWHAYDTRCSIVYLYWVYLHYCLNPTLLKAWLPRCALSFRMRRHSRRVASGWVKSWMTSKLVTWATESTGTRLGCMYLDPKSI